MVLVELTVSYISKVVLLASNQIHTNEVRFVANSRTRNFNLMYERDL